MIKARNCMVLLDITEYTSKTQTTESGLIIQRSTKGLIEDEMNHGPQVDGGIVVSAGDKTHDIKDGDRVLLPKKRGIFKGRLKDGDRTMVWVHESNILAVLEEGE